MLKQTVVAVAIAAAGLMDVSPLAFATGAHTGHVTNTATDTSSGLLNVAHNNVNTPIQACNNDVPVNGGAADAQVPVKDVTGAATGALGLLGSAKPRPTRRSTTRATAATTPHPATPSPSGADLSRVKGAGPSVRRPLRERGCATP